MQLIHRQDQQLSMKVMRISPTLAQHWLQMNTKNRRMNMAMVQRIAEDMVAGRWQLNGESIKFDREGRLLDGQHRLQAIVESGVEVDLLVVTDLPTDAQQSIDIGMARTAGQIAELLDIPNANQMAAVASALIRMENFPNHVWTGTNTASKPQQISYLLEHQSLLEWAIAEARDVYSAIKMPRVPYGVLAVMVHRADQMHLWGPWHARMVDGAGLTPGDPRLVLRNQVLRRVPGNGGWNVQQVIGWNIKAWNAYTEGRSVKLLTFRRDMLPMPTIH